jgi:hypothetical protein
MLADQICPAVIILHRIPESLLLVVNRRPADPAASEF